jgi:DNA-binding response OmpR family regulator
MVKANILIVEDEPILALELKEDLMATGYGVCAIVADGDMVMQALLQYKPDLAIVDIKLFGFRDGFEAMDRIRGFFKTPVLYLTSYPYEQVADRVQRTAPSWYLSKPYDRDKVLSLVGTILGRP